MKKNNLKGLYIFLARNTEDEQYTIVTKVGEIHFVGIDGRGVHNGNIAESYYIVSFGIGWSNHCSPQLKEKMLRSQTKEQVEIARSDRSQWGDEVKDHSTLPENVIKYINQIKFQSRNEKEKEIKRR